MTYAYAMVLENGAHNSNQQPLFSATLQTADSVIRCASPQYFLPTFNNASNGGNATLDSATAESEWILSESQAFSESQSERRGVGRRRASL